jgi:hypothetical protein
MGSLRRPRLYDAEICRLYLAGEARDLIGMKSGLWDREICDVLKRNGVPLRDDAENRAIALRNRQRYKSTLGMVKRLRRAS